MWINATNYWLTLAFENRGYFSNKSLTRDLRGSWGGDLAAILHFIKAGVPVSYSFPCSIFIKISQLEGSGSEEFLTVVTPKKMSQGLVLTCSSKSYQNESVPPPSFLKVVSCFFDLALGTTPGKLEYFSQESHTEDGRESPYDHDLLLLIFH